MTHDSLTSETVLLIRVNSSTELLKTAAAVDHVRRTFPQARLITLATPQTETRTLLEADRRFDEVLLFPPENQAETKSARAFQRFMRRRSITATVVCFGTTTGFDYGRHILSLLLCPGRRFLLDAQNRLFPARSARGLGVLGGTILALGFQKALAPLQRAVARRRRKTPLTSGTAQRILLIRLDHIGDVVLSLPAVHALKAHFPKGRFDALVSSAAAPLLEDLPELNEVIPCDTPRFTRDGRHSSLSTRLALVRRLRRRHYDLAVDLRGDDTGRLWALASGARWRAGLAEGPYEVPGRPNLSYTLTHPLSAAVPDVGPMHAIDVSLQTVKGLGACAPETPFRFVPSAEQSASVLRKRAALGVSDPYALMHVRPGDPIKRWSAASFAAVADHLIQRHGLTVLLTGTSGDAEENQQVIALAQASTGLIDGADAFSLEEFPALCADARLLVTVDTGPMHIAAAVGTPIVALFLPWSASAFHPDGQPDAVVTPSQRGLQALEEAGRLWEGTLLESISVEEVCAAADRKLETAYV